MRASRRTATSEIEPAAILRDGALRLLQDEVCVCLSFIRLIRLVSWNRSTSETSRAKSNNLISPFYTKLRQQGERHPAPMGRRGRIRRVALSCVPYTPLCVLRVFLLHRAKHLPGFGLTRCALHPSRAWPLGETVGCSEQNSSSHGYAKCRRPAAIYID